MVTTIQSNSAPAAPLPGIELDDPVRVAEGLRDEFRAGAAGRDHDRAFPYEQCAAFRASGLLGLMVPREYGGYGGTFAELMRVVIAISAGDSNIGQMYQLHTGGIRLLQEFASPDVQARWLPRFASGELWITNAYSEVGTKSVNDFKTTVTRDGEGWRLNGRKFYCTGSLAGDITFGPCRVEGTDEVRVFYTPTDAEGVTIHDDWTGFGQRTTASGTTEFRNVWIPDELMPRQPGHRGRRRRRHHLAELPGGTHRRVRGHRQERASTTRSSSSGRKRGSGTRAVPSAPSMTSTPSCGSAR